VLAKKRAVFVMFMKPLRRQYHGNHRHLCVELHPHQGVDDARRHEFVPIDAAIHDEAGGYDGAITPGLRQQLRMQWNFECPRHFKALDMLWIQPLLLEFLQEARQGLIDDVAMPA
jgi:hypothetical protein